MDSKVYNTFAADDEHDGVAGVVSMKVEALELYLFEQSVQMR